MLCLYVHFMLRSLAQSRVRKVFDVTDISYTVE
jgi:hypothetical protein